MNEDIKNLAIEAVLDNWFTTVYNKKKRTTRIDIKNKKLMSKCWGMHNDLVGKQKYRDGYEDFKADFMRIIFDLMNTFQPEKHNSSWSEVYKSANANENYDDGKSVVSALSAYVYSGVEFRIKEECSDDYIRFGNSGEKRLYLSVESYNRNINDDDNEEMSKLLDNSNNAFVVSADKIYSSQINNWFQTNKKKILLNSQLMALDQWDTFDIYESSNDHLPAHFNVAHQGNVTEKLYKIANRTLKAFNEASLNKLTQQQIAAKKELDIIESFISILKLNKSNKRNEQLYEILFDIFSKIQLNLKLELDEHIKLNQRQKDLELLNKVCKQLEDRYEKLQSILENVQTFEKQNELVSKPKLRPNWLGNLSEDAKKSDIRTARIITGDGVARMNKKNKNKFGEVRTYSLDDLEVAK